MVTGSGEAIQKVPFFVRKRVSARVAKEARAACRPVVSLADVTATQKRYLNNMSREVKGYQPDTCFGPSGSPNRAIDSSRLLARVETVLKTCLEFYKQNSPGGERFAELMTPDGFAELWQQLSRL